ncbi:hypothetical protein MA16_Dca023249 [Dendrobium catenatum]|uniref:Origin recognition complex subunit 3 N-terminal domain-containing protein n=1 Tax=Dendrobium catenatum TaxID=906689 RepID=A0A2I0W203_9ASPA|nr:hypothetical protein MA16_Dca023249 [Dendrobium catenatum]
MPTTLIFTKNIEFVDDMLMFQDLKGYMQSNGCHTAFLSALDISTKCGIGSCLRSLYKQLVPKASDVVDVPLIASWYCKDKNYDKPIIVIIEDMEQCDSEVLVDFIKMLSERVMKIPIIFILGVTTSFDALRKLLLSSVTHYLLLCKFTLEFLRRRMDSLIEYVLALKLACIKHLSGEPLSFLCPGMLHEDCEAFWSGKCESLSEVLRSYTFDLPSCQRGKTTGDNNLAQGLSKLKWLQNNWSYVVLCLFKVGQQLLSPLTASHESVNGGFISQAIQKVRELPSDSLYQLLGQWSLHNEEVIEMDKEVKVVHSMRNLPSDGHTSKERHTVNIHGCLACSARKKGTPFLNDEATMLLVKLLIKFLVPIENVPFHEIFFFKDVASLKSSLIGDPRSVI